MVRVFNPSTQVTEIGRPIFVSFEVWSDLLSEFQDSWHYTVRPPPPPSQIINKRGLFIYNKLKKLYYKISYQFSCFELTFEI